MLQNTTLSEITYDQKYKPSYSFLFIDPGSKSLIIIV